MKTALITTTINVPIVLALYRKFDPDVQFFVAADLKTPLAAYEFCATIPNCEIYSPDRQKELGYECSALIGWNTISRRNIALLEALRWGADVIFSVDDDNAPIRGYAEHFQKLWYHPPGQGERWYRNRYDISGAPYFHGLEATAPLGWFDPGNLSFPNEGLVVQRGFPLQRCSAPAYKPVTSVKIGVAQGVILGDPDTSAVDRISKQPEVHQVSELLRAGVVTNPKDTWAPLNSQNIAFLRCLAPCFLMVPQFMRFDDIYASLIAQRVMRELDYCVHYGKPFVHQQRNEHDLLKDLRAEQWGSENILAFAEWLDRGSVSKDVLESLNRLWSGSWTFDGMPEGVKELGKAWIDDCRKVMG